MRGNTQSTSAIPGSRREVAAYVAGSSRCGGGLSGLASGSSRSADVANVCSPVASQLASYSDPLQERR